MSEASLAGEMPARPRGASATLVAAARTAPDDHPGRAAQPDHAVPGTRTGHRGGPAARNRHAAGQARWRFRGHDLPALGRFVGLTAATITLVLFGLLHVLVARLSPLTDTLSDYALSSARGMFNTGVLLLAAGSVFLLFPLLRRGGTPARGGESRPRGRLPRRPGHRIVSRIAALCFAIWFAGLVVLTAFPRDPVGVPVTVTGEIHQWASVGALLGLPVGALLTAWRHRGPGARAVAALATVCLATLVPFVTAYLAGSPLRPYLGLLERVVALLDIALLLVLGTVSLAARVPVRSTANG